MRPAFKFARMKAYWFIFCLMAACMCGAKPVNVIFDTDMGNDVDDALALVMLYAFRESGECNLKGILINKDNPYAPVYTDIIAKYYGADSVPMGMVEDGVTKDPGLFVEKISEEKNADGSYKYARNMDPQTKLPSAVKLARKIMSESEDGGLVYISVGFSTNLAAIFRSGPDELSPLNGLELFKKKVKYVSLMAGNFSRPVLDDPYSVAPEFNVGCDKPSAKFVYETCPVPMVFNGFEIGLLAEFPNRVVAEELPNENPLVESFRLYTNGSDRPTWDLISVLYVFRPGMFGLSENGLITSSDSGHTFYKADSDGNRRFLKTPDKETAEKIKAELVRLCTYKK